MVLHRRTRAASCKIFQPQLGNEEGPWKKKMYETCFILTISMIELNQFKGGVTKDDDGI